MSAPSARRACLVVDHPLRDLDGLVLVGAELAARGWRVDLVPMYHKHEVFLLAPDVLLINYVRFANIDFVRSCRRLGIPVVVLDTEGGVRQDLGVYAEQLRPYAGDISMLCVWGHAQREAVAEAVAQGGAELRLTGSPRYDFAVQPWSGALAPVLDEAAPVVLVNTNFPLADPRFQSARRETRELTAGMGMEEERVRRLVDEVTRVRAEVTATIGKLARALPEATFVVRPHPFERHDFYRDQLAGLDNVRVAQSHTVLHWMRHATIVLHHNCSTAIEAFLTGREPVFLAFIEAPLLLQPTSVSVSRSAASFEDLLGLTREALNGGMAPAPEDLRARRRRVVTDYFCADDGAAHRRVADALEEAARTDRRHEAPGVLRALRAQRRWQAVAALAASALFGGRALDRFRRATRRPSDPAKAVRLEAVEDTLQRLANVEPRFGRLAARPARARGTGRALHTITIERA